MLNISLIICTFERPVLVERAVQSILDMDGLDGVNLDIVVVDNSDSGSARGVIGRMARASRVPVRYIEAHPPNISVARNAGVAATGAEVVAFLDDDQEVEAGWLRAVLDGLARFPHDVFFGAIRPRFEETGPVNPHARAMFTRSIASEAGSNVVAFGPQTGPRFPLATANCIIRRARCLTENGPFDETFGNCGGEDLHLFCRLQNAGRRFAWLPGAAASDFIPQHRSTHSYLAKRHYSGGQVFAAAMIKSSPTPRSTAALIFGKAVLQAALLLLAAPVRLTFGRSTVKDLELRIASVRGKLFWWTLYPLYRHEQPALPSATSSLAGGALLGGPAAP